MRPDEVQRLACVGFEDTRPAAARLEPVQRLCRERPAQSASDPFTPTHSATAAATAAAAAAAAAAIPQARCPRAAPVSTTPEPGRALLGIASLPCDSTPARHSTASSTTVTRRIRHNSRMGTRTIRRRVTRAGRRRLRSRVRPAASVRVGAATERRLSCLSRCRLGSTLSYGPGASGRRSQI